MSARIVFADGSRALARNNDDLFDRWIIRRHAEQEQRPVPADVIDTPPDFVPPLPPLTGLEQARAIRLDRNEREFILTNRKMINIEDYNAGRLDVKTYSFHKSAIKAEMAKLGIQRKVIADYMRACNPITDDSRFAYLLKKTDEERDELDERCKRLYRENLELKRRLAEMEGQS